MLCQFGDAANRLDDILNHWDEMHQLSPLQRFVSCMRQIAVSMCNSSIIVFIDEIDYITLLPFSTDEFFAAIRECHNRKATDDALGRLTFCLLGVAVSTDLIQDVSTTPFNVGHRIVLTDFGADEMDRLKNGLGIESARDASRVMDRVLYWSGGHPYMTQRICAALAARGCHTPREVGYAGSRALYAGDLARSGSLPGIC
jgi:AAA-like domain